MMPLLRNVGIGFLLLGLLGCGSEESSNTAGGEKKPLKVADEYVEQGDMEALLARGRIRIAVPGNLQGGLSLPRQGSPISQQQDLAEAFAKSLGLEAELVPVSSLADMLPTLESGKADLVAANFTVTEERKKRIAFSLPIAHVLEQLIVSSSNTNIRKLADLKGKKIMVHPATSFWATMKQVQEKVPGLILMKRPGDLDDEDVLDLIASGDIDGAVRDSNIMTMYSGYRDDVKPAFSVSKERAIAWGVRPNAPELLRALNKFLTQEKMTRPRQLVYEADLPQMKDRKVLRVLLPNSASSYYLWRGELRGFEYELARRFANRQGLRLEVVVPPRKEDGLKWLEEGKADIAGGFLIADHNANNIAYSRRYHVGNSYFLGRKDDVKLEGLKDLLGRTIVLHKDNYMWPVLMNLQAETGFELKEAPLELSVEAIIDKVARGEFDLTVMDSQEADIQLAVRDDIRRQLALDGEQEHVWAVRKQSPKLLKALNSFFKKEYRGTFYNIVYKRYFKNDSRIRLHQEGRLAQNDGALSPYDDLVRNWASKYDFDWRLLVAQMFQESRFDPKAKSNAGALGLMQVLPSTAKQFGITDLHNPALGVQAGVRYMDWVRDRFPQELPVTDRMWFSLASYNAGLGHVIDARRLAAKQGWDRNRWFGNVERAMLLLSQRKYHSKARHGYVRGKEPVNYVSQIRSRYQAYVRLSDQNVAMQ